MTFHKNLTRIIWVAMVIPILLLVVVSIVAAPNRNGKIAFVSDRDGNPEIYVMNADGSGQTRLTDNFGPDAAPAWSPDGKRIAFISWRPSGMLCVMNADGTNVVEITPTNSNALTWSPNGREIAFLHFSPGTTEGDILSVNVSGGLPRVITGGPENDYSPAWSPDGSKILFSRYIEGTPSGTVLHTIRPDGTGLTTFPNGFADGIDDYLGAWSPDGSSIVFTVNAWDFWTSIFIAKADGSDRRFFHGCTGPSNCGFSSSTTDWSPDGRKIVFETYNDFQNDVEIFTKNINGSGLAQLTNTPWRNWGPSWQTRPLQANVEAD